MADLFSISGSYHYRLSNDEKSNLSRHLSAKYGIELDFLSIIYTIGGLDYLYIIKREENHAYYYKRFINPNVWR
jgi:hypothetical protein